MRKKNLLLTAFVAAAGLSAEEYKIDPAHSAAQFSVRHMMVSNVRGQFSRPVGTIFYDEKNPAATVVEASIDATTINTGEPKRDDHLRSPDFFEVARFPTITFKSKRAQKMAAGLSITGDLTMHGVTREVVLDVEGPSPEIKDARGGGRRGASATTRISRKDFGLTWNRVLEAGGAVVGDEVLITIDIEAIRAPPAPAK